MYKKQIKNENEVMDEENNADDTYEFVEVSENKEYDTVRPNEIIQQPMNDIESFNENIHYTGHRESIQINTVSDITEINSNKCSEYKPARKTNDSWKWIVLSAAFIISVCIDGVALSFSVLSDEIAHIFNTHSQQKYSLVGSVFIAIPILTGPIMSALVDRYGCRFMTIMAGLVTTIAFSLAAVCNSVPMLCLTYGVIGGLAVGILHVTSHVSVALWFNEKRYLVLSLLSSSIGIGPLVFSPMIQYFLKRFGWSRGMVMVGGVLLHVCICGALMRTPPALEKVQKKRNRMLNKTTKLSSSLSSRTIDDESNCNSEVAMQHEVECNSNPAILPVAMKPKVLTDSGSEEYGEDNKDKINPTNSSTNRNDEQDVHEHISLRNRCMEVLSDHNYLKDMILHKKYMVYRGAMMSIPKYKLRSTMQPDVYHNSNYSLNSLFDRENVPYLRIWMTPEFVQDNVPLLTKTRFILFNICLFNASAWSIFPYFFLKSLMDENKVDGGVTIIIIISIASIIGTIIVEYCCARQLPWKNLKVVYIFSIIVGGISLLVYPHSVGVYWACALTSIIFGISFASIHILTPRILIDLIPIDIFTTAYCIVLLAQGLGYLVGPPIGGLLYNSTQKWSPTFWLGGTGMVLAGVLMCVAYVTSTKNDEDGQL